MPEPLADVSAVLKQLRTVAGFTVTEVADFLGIPRTSYDHYEKRYKKRYLPFDLADKLAGLFATRGIDPGDVFALTGADVAVEALLHMPPGLGEAEAARYDPEPSDHAVIQALYPGRANADLWEIKSRALDLAGWLPGDIAIVDLGRSDWRPGDVVCATLHDFHAGTSVTVFRIYDPPHLLSASTDPQFRKPLSSDLDNPHIRGLVVAGYRRRPPSVS